MEGKKSEESVLEMVMPSLYIELVAPPDYPKWQWVHLLAAVWRWGATLPHLHLSMDVFAVLIQSLRMDER